MFVLIIIIILLFFIILFYFYTKRDNCEIKRETTKLAILNTINFDKIETNIVNVIIYNDTYYIYSNKNFNEENKVSLFIYLEQHKNILYGKLDKLIRIDDISIYKLIIENKKINNCEVDIDLNQITKIVNYIKYMD